MQLISILKRTTSLIFTPIENINFETKEVIDQELMEELEIEVGSKIRVFNLKSQVLETVNVNSVKEGGHYWYSKEGKLFKIIHLI